MSAPSPQQNRQEGARFVVHAYFKCICEYLIKHMFLHTLASNYSSLQQYTAVTTFGAPVLCSLLQLAAR